MKTLFSRFVKDESGVTAIEYGLIAALIGVMIIGGATVIGTQLGDAFDFIGGQLKGANEASGITEPDPT